MGPVQLSTDDGLLLAGDLLDPPDGVDVTGAAVVCHPHPAYGGDRHHPVVDALWRGYAAAGFHAVRFDFRRPPGGGGDGVAERSDVLAALDLLTAGHPDLPVTLAGYSFGAAVALSVRDRRVVAAVAVAPPLTMMPVDPPPAVPALVLVPAHDQFCPPDVAAPVVATWPHAELRVVPSADHFMAGRASAAAADAVAWSRSSRPPSSAST